MNLPHTGAWGTPDFGITERLASGPLGFLTGGQQRNTQGGSDIFRPPTTQGQVQGASTDTGGPGGAFPIAQPRPVVDLSNANVLQDQTTQTSTNTGGGSPQGTNPFDEITPEGVQPSEIDALYNSTFDVLNQAEQNLRNQKPGLIQEANQQAEAARSRLKSGVESQKEVLGQQEQRIEQTGQSQEAEQRRILQELQLANQQRFGGASSAGQAASEIQGREFQKNRFGIQQQVQQGIQQIQQRYRDVEREYQTGLQQLEANATQALNNIQRMFDDKLLEINARRGEAEQAKQNARLQALQDLRNQAYEIKVAKAQYEADLRNQAQANTQYLTQAQQQLLQYGQSGVQAGDQVAGYQASGIPGVDQGNGVVGRELTGSINDDELYGNINFPGASSRDPRFQNVSF